MTDNAYRNYDLVIVGAGMVGAALALSLRTSGLKIALLDAASGKPEPGDQASSLDAYSPRVSALTAQSQAFLQALDVWPQIAGFACAYEHMRVWDALGTEHIAFDAADIPAASLGYIVENERVVAALHEALSSVPEIDVLWHTTLQGLSREVQGEHHFYLLRSEQAGSSLALRANMVVGADGALSRVRQLAQLPTREWDYQHDAIVCTVKTSGSHQATAWQRFDETGPVAFLPLADVEGSMRYSSIVWSQKSDEAKRLLALNDADFKRALAAAIESRLGTIEGLSARYSFPLRQRHAKRYVQDQLVLVGDAAHSIHPLAGQGVNLGFKDVAVLSANMLRAQASDLPVWQAHYLAKYQRERQADNLLMMGAMEFFKRLFEQPDPVVRLLRNAGMGWLNQQRPLKNLLARQAMGL